MDDQQIEQILLDTARDWANGSKEGVEEGVEEGEITTSLIDDSPSLFERAELADTWLNREVAELNFIFRAAAILALSQVKSRVQDWVSDELTSRIIPLYQGAVGQGVDHEEQRLISSMSPEFADVSEASDTSQ